MMTSKYSVYSVPIGEFLRIGDDFIFDGDGSGGVELGEMKISPFSGGWGVLVVSFGFRLSNMMDVRTVRYHT